MPTTLYRGGTPLLDKPKVNIYIILGMGETCLTLWGIGYYHTTPQGPLFTGCPC
jgi:hypothetical protein